MRKAAGERAGAMKRPFGVTATTTVAPTTTAGTQEARSGGCCQVQSGALPPVPPVAWQAMLGQVLDRLLHGNGHDASPAT